MAIGFCIQCKHKIKLNDKGKICKYVSYRHSGAILKVAAPLYKRNRRIEKFP